MALSGTVDRGLEGVVAGAARLYLLEAERLYRAFRGREMRDDVARTAWTKLRCHGGVPGATGEQ